MFNRFDTETRIAVMQAIDEARDLGHDQVGTDHLLLGLLANARGDAARALTQAGLDFPTAEAAVIAYHEANPTAEPEAESASADEELDDDLAADREALAAVGIDLDSVRDAVRRRFGTDIADGWGGGRRGDGFGPRGRGRGRRGPRSDRLGPMRRFSPELRAVITSLMHEAKMDFAQSRLDEAQERLNEQREAGPRDFADSPDGGPRGFEGRGPRGRGRGHHTHHRFAPGGPREGMRPGPGEWGFGPGEFDGRGPGRGEGRGEGRGARRGFGGGPRLSADKALVALLQSDDPALAAVLGQVDRAAIIAAVSVDA